MLLLVTLMSTRCAKDSDDLNIDEDQAYLDLLHNQSPEKTTSDWNTFHKTADNLVAIAESNLKSLSLRNNRKKEDSEAGLEEIYAKCDYDLTDLKEQLQRRDEGFARELNDYDGSSASANNAFKNKFLQEIADLNTTMEGLINKDTKKLPE